MMMTDQPQDSRVSDRVTTESARVVVEERLRHYTFFRNAPVSLQHTIAMASRAVKLPAGHYVFRNGDTLPHVAFVSSGQVRVFMTGNNGREITLYHVGPGESCPINLLGTLMQQPAFADAHVESDVEAVVTPGQHFIQWAASEPAVSQFVYESLANRLNDVLLKLDQIAFQHIDQRIATYLQKRFEHEAPLDGRIVVTHEEIANEIGSAREVVSRLLKGFQKSGVLKLGRGSIELTNPEQLQDSRVDH